MALRKHQLFRVRNSVGFSPPFEPWLRRAYRAGRASSQSILPAGGGHFGGGAPALCPPASIHLRLIEIESASGAAWQHFFRPGGGGLPEKYRPPVRTGRQKTCAIPPATESVASPEPSAIYPNLNRARSGGDGDLGVRWVLAFLAVRLRVFGPRCGRGSSPNRAPDYRQMQSAFERPRRLQVSKANWPRKYSTPKTIGSRRPEGWSTSAQPACVTISKPGPRQIRLLRPQSALG